jgi:hypothetical protein
MTFRNWKKSAGKNWRRNSLASNRKQGFTMANGGHIEVAQKMAAHSNAKTMGLYDWHNDDISVGGVERFDYLKGGDTLAEFLDDSPDRQQGAGGESARTCGRGPDRRGRCWTNLYQGNSGLLEGPVKQPLPTYQARQSRSDAPNFRP